MRLTSCTYSQSYLSIPLTNSLITWRNPSVTSHPHQRTVCVKKWTCICIHYVKVAQWNIPTVHYIYLPTKTSVLLKVYTDWVLTLEKWGIAHIPHTLGTDREVNNYHTVCILSKTLECEERVVRLYDNVTDLILIWEHWVCLNQLLWKPKYIPQVTGVRIEFVTEETEFHFQFQLYLCVIVSTNRITRICKYQNNGFVPKLVPKLTKTLGFCDTFTLRMLFLAAIISEPASPLLPHKLLADYQKPVITRIVWMNSRPCSQHL